MDWVDFLAAVSDEVHGARVCHLQNFAHVIEESVRAYNRVSHAGLPKLRDCAILHALIINCLLIAVWPGHLLPALRRTSQPDLKLRELLVVKVERFHQDPFALRGRLDADQLAMRGHVLLRHPSPSRRAVHQPDYRLMAHLQELCKL